MLQVINSDSVQKINLGKKQKRQKIMLKVQIDSCTTSTSQGNWDIEESRLKEDVTPT
jgi:hypothetical protein